MGTCGIQAGERNQDRIAVRRRSTGFLSTLASSLSMLAVENFLRIEQLARPAATSCCRSRADRFDALLFTRRAGVHVDFHAHRHFHNLRSFPTHEGLPSTVWHDVRAGTETRLTSNVAQAWKGQTLKHLDAPDAKNFPLGQSYFALGQGRRTSAADRRMRRIGRRRRRLRTSC
jgi:hypothetical protein